MAEETHKLVERWKARAEQWREDCYEERLHSTRINSELRKYKDAGVWQRFKYFLTGKI